MKRTNVTARRFNRFPLSAVLISTLLLSACESEDSRNPVVEVDDAPVSAVVNLGGGVTKGPVAGATVNVFAVGDDGVKAADPVATTTTDENGEYTVELTNFSGVYLIEASGGIYVDEATGATKTIAVEAPLRAASTADSSTGSVTVTAAVTPLTEIAVQVAGQKGGALTAENVSAGNDEVGALFFGEGEGAGEKLLSTTPADITSEDSATASDDERVYGLILGAISALESNTGSLGEAVTAIASDIAADGNLSDSSEDLIAATNKVISGATNNSGVTSASKISNILTAAASGPGTDVALSSDADITAFSFADTLLSSIDAATRTVTLLQPSGTDVSTLATPTIAISLGGAIAPEQGEDFAAPVDYVVTAEDGTTATWTVTVTVAESDASPFADVTGAIHELIESAVINRTLNVVVGTVGNLDDLTALDEVADPAEIFSVSDGATLQFVSGSYATGNVMYLVTAENGTATKEWSVALRVNDPQPQPTFNIANGDLSLPVTSEPVQIETTGGHPDAPLSFSTSDSDVVSVDATGLLSIVGSGIARVSASKARIETPVVDYLAATSTIDVTVDKLEQSTLMFGQASISVPLNGLVVNELSGGSGGGQVTYSSSDESVATVTSQGVVTLIGIGTTTISAIKAGSSIYLESNEASYSLTVTEEAVATCVFDESNWDECLID